MKQFLFTIVAFFALNSQIASAETDTACNKAYGQTVSFCAQGLSALSPNMRAGAQKACVAEAKIAKEQCLSGVNLCLDACTAQYDNNVAQCNAVYDPALCNGNLSCEAFINAQRSACTSASVDVLNACNASCPIP